MFNLYSKKYFFILLFAFFIFHTSFSQDLTRIKHFGKNNGHLKMFLHTPSNIDTNKPAPLVVVLHGCLQCAGTVQEQSGWSKLAGENGFYVLYPQQRITNNLMRCFRWYKRKQTKKNKGENYSIIQMVEYMKNNYNIDSTQVFITGLSAGAAMSVIMMSDYPETFNAGAIFAGGAYKSGYGNILGLMAMLGWRIKSPEKWASYVRTQNPGFKGDYPRMIIYQGNNDWFVNKRNGVELMKQWTNLHNIGTQPSETIEAFATITDIRREAYISIAKKEAVVFYKINNLSHALLVDPGECKCQGGQTGLFARDKNYFSTLWTAYDFGLIVTPEITGPQTVFANNEVSYSVLLTSGSTYEWSYPPGCTLKSGQNTNTITLTWGTAGGCINVTETNADNCKKQYKTLLVTLNDLK